MKASLAVGGGLLLEFDTAALAAETPAFAPNAFLRITPDDVIRVVLARVDMGQGTATMHAQFIAEELGVDPRTLTLELSGADHAYDNPAMGFQMTGGSSSTTVSWQPYQRAGAAAREMLISAAAKQWGVPRSECSVAAGAVVHPPSKRSARFGALATLAATLPVPSVEPKHKHFSTLGVGIPRVDAAMKVNGTAVYGIDVQVPDALVAVLLRCPVPRGTLKAFDATQAKALEGVVAVLEVPQGVAVVGTTYWHAKRGAAAVTCEWNEGALANFDSASLLAKHRELLRGTTGKRVHERGDLASGLKAATVLEAEYAAPFLAHATMEPQNATARFVDSKLEVWAPTQGPGATRSILSRRLDLPESDITVHQTWVGGGFGRRIAQDYALEAASVSRALGGKPVKVVWSREDDMQHSPYRPAATHLVRGAIDAEGRIQAWHHRVATQSILSDVIDDFAGAVFSGAPRFVQRLLGSLASGRAEVDESAFEGIPSLPYEMGALAVDFVRHEPGVPSMFWRSVANSHTAFATESFVDELAWAAKQDPYLFRRARLMRQPRHRWVLELAAEKAGWSKPAAPGVGRGIAVHKAFDSYAAAVAEVKAVDGAIRVQRLVMALDCGRVMNPDIVKSQVESCAIFGLSATLHGAITFEKGRVQQSNFHQYAPLRLNECPTIETHLRENDAPPTGVGEPGLPVIAPAVANAVYALTKQRLRSLPLSLEVKAS
jgi:isoquinoline 1-oxidoreductase subunit beta